MSAAILGGGGAASGGYTIGGVEFASSGGMGGSSNSLLPLRGLQIYAPRGRHGGIAGHMQMSRRVSRCLHWSLPEIGAWLQTRRLPRLRLLRALGPDRGR